MAGVAAGGRRLSFPSNPVGQPAVTSLAVMAFLSRGHLPGQGRYGQQINRAIDIVLDQQSRRGYFSLLAGRAVGRAPETAANAHLQPLHRRPDAGRGLRHDLRRAIARIEEALAKALVFSRSVQTRQKQHPDEAGGWRYAYPDSPDANSDLSVTGWALMFYRSARNAEFEVPKQYFDEGLDFVERCYVTDPADREEGIFRYRPSTVQANARPTLANTGSAMLDADARRPPRDGDGPRRASIGTLPRNYPAADKAGHFYLAAYYSSQAMAQVGGATWNRVYPANCRAASQGANAQRRLAGRPRERKLVRLELFHVAGRAGPDAAVPASADLSALAAGLVVSGESPSPISGEGRGEGR